MKPGLSLPSTITIRFPVGVAVGLFDEWVREISVLGTKNHFDRLETSESSLAPSNRDKLCSSCRFYNDLLLLGG